MKRFIGIITLFIFSWVSTLIAQEDMPGYTVEGYYTYTEVAAFNEENKLHLENASARLQNEISGIMNRLKSGSINAAEADSQISQLLSNFTAENNRHQSEKETQLYSGGYQYLLYSDETIIEEEYVYEDEENWADDWGDMSDFDMSEYMPKPKRFYSSMVLAIGFHTLLNTPATAPDINFFKSGLFEFGIMSRIRIGADKSPYWYNIGLSWVNQGVRWKGNSYLQDRETPTFTESALNLRSNRFSTSNIVLNTGFAYIQSKKRGLLLELNGFVGWNISTNSEIQYKTPENGSKSEFIYGKYGVNRFNYGLTAAIGIKNLALYTRYDLSPLFKQNNVFDAHPFSIGIRFF
jgi:hypothetical protein